MCDDSQGTLAQLGLNRENCKIFYDLFNGTLPHPDIEYSASVLREELMSAASRLEHEREKFSSALVVLSNNSPQRVDQIRQLADKFGRMEDHKAAVILWVVAGFWDGIAPKQEEVECCLV
jgi:hypothetical protein